MSRKSTNWLGDYLDMTKHQKSPELFHLWTGIFTIAATLERSVYWDGEFFKLFPNMLVVLVAPPGRCAKTTALAIGRDMLRQVPDPPLVLSQKITPQFLIKELSKDPKNDDGTNSSAVCFSREFTVLVGQDAFQSGLTDILGDLYDCPEEEEYYGTILRGKAFWRRGCLNIAGATTPTHIKRVIPRAELGGGFVSRVIFVERDSGRGIARPYMTAVQRKLRDNLVEDLKTIRLLRGEYKLTPEAEKWYDEFYFQQEKSTKWTSEYTARFPQHILKISMCLAASLTDVLLISVEHLELANKMLTEIERCMTPVVQHLEMTQHGEHAERVLSIIRSHPDGIMRNELSRATWRFAKKADLDGILEQLAESNEIAIRRFKQGRMYVPLYREEEQADETDVS